MDASGRRVRRLTHDKLWYWSPVFLDSRTVVFMVGPTCWPSDDWDQISVDGRGRRRFGTGIDDIEVSPNRRWIAFVSVAQNLYVMRADDLDRRTGSITNPITDAELVTKNVGMYAWSPDGTMLAFDAVHSQGSQVYVVRLPNGRPRQLSRLPAIADHPVWSPNGGQLEYSSSTLAPNTGGGTSREVLIRPDGSDRRIFPGGGKRQIIAWLQDGDLLSQGEGGVELVRGDRSVVRHLASQPAALSPNGTAAIYDEDGGQAPSPRGCPKPVVGPPDYYSRIDVVNLRTGTTHPLTQP
jgi:dipeptidyl aminopeptidase/acylaminoacyl peptidase